MSSTIFDMSDRLLSAMLNGVLQGVLVCAVVAVALRFWPRTNAATRHAVWFGLLLLVAGLIPLNYWLNKQPAAAGGTQAQPGIDHSSPFTGSEVIGTSYIPFVPPPSDGTEGGSAVEYPLSGTTPSEPIPSNNHFSLETDEQVYPEPEPPINLQSAQGSSEAEKVVSTTVQGESSKPAGWMDLSRITALLTRPANVIRLEGVPRRLSLTIISMVAIIALARLVMLGWRVHTVRLLKKVSRAPLASLNERFELLCAQKGVRRPVRLRISPEEASPVVLGFFRPVILLPASQQSREIKETEQILAHEVAHIQRNDDWLNLVQHTIQGLLFFHPGVFWIGRQLSLEREIACDDYALQNDSAARSYALLLTDLATRVCKSRPMLAPGVSTGKSQLQQRINMILNTNRNTSPLLGKTRLGILATAATGCAALLVCGAPRLLLAQAGNAAPAADPAAIVSSSGTVVSTAAAAPRAATVSNGGVLFADGGTGPTITIETTPEPEAPQAPGVPPGAKSKDAPEDLVPLPPAPPVAGVALPAPAAAPVPPAVVPHPFNFALAGPAPRPRGPAKIAEDDSVEARLNRLEEMVRSLMDQQKNQPMQPNVWFNDNKNRAHPKAWALTPDGITPMQPGFPDIERAEQQAKEAAKQREKAMKDSEHARAEAGDKAQAKRLEALRKMRGDLERQMHQLEREIEKLEQAKDRLQSELDRHQELLDQSGQEEEELAQQEAN